MLTAVVIAYNEEKRITDCLASLSFCEEIVLIDGFSQDKTIKNARKFTSRVFKRKLKNDFSRQRNFGLSKASGDWILFVDADEIVSPGLKREIKSVLKKKTDFNGFYLPRQDIFLGKKLRYGEFYNFKLLRLAKKGNGKWTRPVHEVWQVKGKIGSLKNPLLHYSHESISKFLEKINFYSTINADFLYRKKIKGSFFQILSYPLGKFVFNFIIKKGYKDGFMGFFFAVFMSFHSFLVRSKLFLKDRGYEIN